MDEPRAKSDASIFIALANLTAQITDTNDRVLERVNALDRLVGSRFQAAETALDAAKEALDSRMKAGDQELLSHIQAQRISVDAALTALKDLDKEREKAQDKFEDTVRHEFESVNEFRAALDDLGKLMSTRREVEDFKQSTDQRFTELSKQIVALGSRLDIGPPALETIQSRLDRSTGRGEGVSGAARTAAAVLASVLVLLGIFTAVQASRNQTGRDQPQIVTVTVPIPAPATAP